MYKTVYFILVMANFVLVISNFILNWINTDPPGSVPISVFHGKVDDLQSYHLVPLNAIMLIFSFVCTYHALWVIYSLVVKDEKLRPYILPLPVILLNAVATLQDILWITVINKHKPLVACAMQVSVFIPRLASLVIALARFQTAKAAKAALMQHSDTWSTIVLVHNGIAFQTAWASGLAVFNLGLALVAADVMTYYTAAVFSICAQGIVMALFAALDLTVLQQWSRYLISPYALHLLLCKGYIFTWLSVPTIVLLVCGNALLVLKVAVVLLKVWRGMFHPARDHEMEPTNFIDAYNMNISYICDKATEAK